MLRCSEQDWARGTAGKSWIEVSVVDCGTVLGSRFKILKNNFFFKNDKREPL